MNELVENGKTLGEYIKQFVDIQSAICLAWFMWVNYFNEKDDK